ncbi:hypothetical protein EJB05_44559, partial [Eragrostis curvula]
MDASGDIQAVASLRRNSRSIWRHGDDVFSCSLTESELDDEKALRWAALEKLPTRHRVHHTIVHPLRDDGQQRVLVNVAAGLGPRER